MSESVLLKLDRAQKHLKEFEADSRNWIASNPYGIIDEANPNTLAYMLNHPDIQHRRFRITKEDPVPDRLSLPIGDCLFNIRSALDHLALALAEAFTPGMTEKQISGSEFPIFGMKPMDTDSKTRKIGCIHPDARIAIKALQPHHRGKDYITHPLWKLHDLNRIDKHRSLTSCVIEPVHINSGGVANPCVGIRVHKAWNIRAIAYARSDVGKIVKDAIFLRYGALPVEAEKPVYMKPILPTEIVFSGSGPAARELVLPTLQAILDFVRDSVVSQLSKFL